MGTKHARLWIATAALALLPLTSRCTAPGKGPAAGSRTADLYVATNGNDAWSGTVPAPNADATDGPFASLARARDAVRQRLAAGAKAATVLIREGTYRLTETVVFSLPDSARDGGQVVYAAYPGEKPVLSSGRPILDWRELGELPAELPDVAKGKVWVADVASLGTFRTLFDGDRELPRARSRGFRQTNSTPRGTPDDAQTVQFPKGAVRRYANLHDAELRIIPCFFWVMNLLPIESIDEGSRTLRTTVPGTYPLGKNDMADHPTAWVENVLEELDEPGEWVLDTVKGRLYLWPEGDRPSRGIVAPALTELIRVEGRVDHDGPADTPVKGLVLRGLTFTHGDRLPWHGRTGWGLQHDWEMFDKPTALVRLRGAEDCAVEDCEFKASGHTAVRLDLHARRNRVVGNHIHHVGGVGVLLAGYGPGAKDVNKHNEVANNHIHHIGQQCWGSGAIFAWQSGENHIAHNLIHHIPYTAILATGRISRTPPGPGECSRTIRWDEVPDEFRGWPWAKREPYLHARKNLIEYNDIHNAMEVLGDGNCIYISGAGGGNVVRGNYGHDCTGRYMNAVIRCDDDQHGTLMEGNICARTGGSGEGFISKGDNDILNNVVADLRPVEHHRGYIVFPYGDISGARVEHNILYSRRKGQTLYFAGRGSQRRPEAPDLRTTHTDHNLYWCSADRDWAKRHFATFQAQGLDVHSVAADPQFRDIGRGDFGFQPGSPAPALGIHPLDASAAGLEEPYRTRLLGRRITTVITPAGGVLKAPATVAISCDTPGAVLRYTLDGAEPTAQSRLYTGPFLLEHPAILRARAFFQGATDAVGASAQFLPPPQPIIEGFEAAPVDAVAPNATTSEDAKKTQHRARVTDEQAASGKHSLKFTDGPGQEHPFDPHVYYRCRFTEGPMVGRFAIRLDAQAQFRYQWRHYEGNYHEGPTVFITPGGKVTHAGRELLTIPCDTWVRFAVDCGVGDLAAGKYTVRVWLPGATEPRVFAGLACDAAFTRLDWVGFVANGQRECTFYLDDIEVRPGE